MSRPRLERRMGARRRRAISRHAQYLMPRLRLARTIVLVLACACVAQAAMAANPAARSPSDAVGTEAAPARATRVLFELDVQPILGKAGCNSGACHGKARGQNGFALSLLGFDADADYDAIVKGGRGRRVFPGAVEHSLLLRKASAAEPHGGGLRLERGSRSTRPFASGSLAACSGRRTAIPNW